MRFFRFQDFLKRHHSFPFFQFGIYQTFPGFFVSKWGGGVTNDTVVLLL